MSKIIAVGDIHGRSSWKLPFYNEEWDHFVFIGDYFDTREGFTPAEQIANFREIMEAKGKGKVHYCIGNHDHHYFHDVGWTGTSNYQEDDSKAIGDILEEYRSQLWMAHQIDDNIFSHAGISEVWLKKNMWIDEDIVEHTNNIWKMTPKAFNFCPNYMGKMADKYGDSVWQSPIWIRPSSLINGSIPFLEKGLNQIVGHTGQQEMRVLQFQDGDKDIPGKVALIDTLGTSGEYLIINNGEFTTGKTR